MHYIISAQREWPRTAIFSYRESVLGTHICHPKAMTLSLAPSHQVDIKISWKYILSQPALNGWLAKWTILLQNYDTEYLPLKVIKGQALTNILEAYPILGHSPLATVSKKKWWWPLRKDGRYSSTALPETKGGMKRGCMGYTWIGILFVSPDNVLIPYSLSLTTGCSNDIVDKLSSLAQIGTWNTSHQFKHLRRPRIDNETTMLRIQHEENGIDPISQNSRTATRKIQRT